jgi:hypothetical protein
VGGPQVSAGWRARLGRRAVHVLGPAGLVALSGQLGIGRVALRVGDGQVLLAGYLFCSIEIGWCCNTRHVWMEVLVLGCSKLTPKLTLWSQTPVLVWC